MSGRRWAEPDGTDEIQRAARGQPPPLRPAPVTPGDRVVGEFPTRATPVTEWGWAQGGELRATSSGGAGAGGGRRNRRQGYSREAAKPTMFLHLQQFGGTPRPQTSPSTVSAGLAGQRSARGPPPSREQPPTDGGGSRGGGRMGVYFPTPPGTAPAAPPGSAPGGARPKFSIMRGRGGPGGPGGAVPLISRTHSPPKGLWADASGGQAAPSLEESAWGRSMLSLFPEPTPLWSESDGFWQNVVGPCLGKKTKEDISMLEMHVRDRLQGRLGHSEEEAADEASRLLKAAFHELYRKVPSFMAAMKKTRAMVERGPQAYHQANEMLGRAMLNGEAMARTIDKLREEAARQKETEAGLRARVASLESQLHEAKDQVDRLSERVIDMGGLHSGQAKGGGLNRTRTMGRALSRRNTVGREAAAAAAAAAADAREGGPPPARPGFKRMATVRIPSHDLPPVEEGDDEDDDEDSDAPSRPRPPGKMSRLATLRFASMADEDDLFDDGGAEDGEEEGGEMAARGRMQLGFGFGKEDSTIEVPEDLLEAAAENVEAMRELLVVGQDAQAGAADVRGAELRVERAVAMLRLAAAETAGAGRWMCEGLQECIARCDAEANLVLAGAGDSNPSEMEARRVVLRKHEVIETLLKHLDEWSHLEHSDEPSDRLRFSTLSTVYSRLARLDTDGALKRSFHDLQGSMTLELESLSAEVDLVRAELAALLGRAAAPPRPISEVRLLELEKIAADEHAKHARILSTAAALATMGPSGESQVPTRMEISARASAAAGAQAAASQQRADIARQVASDATRAAADRLQSMNPRDAAMLLGCSFDAVPAELAKMAAGGVRHEGHVSIRPPNSRDDHGATGRLRRLSGAGDAGGPGGRVHVRRSSGASFIMASFHDEGKASAVDHAGGGISDFESVLASKDGGASYSLLPLPDTDGAPFDVPVGTSHVSVGHTVMRLPPSVDFEGGAGEGGLGGMQMRTANLWKKGAAMVALKGDTNMLTLMAAVQSAVAASGVVVLQHAEFKAYRSTAEAVVVLERQEGSDGKVSVEVATTDGSAFEGTDYARTRQQGAEEGDCLFYVELRNLEGGAVMGPLARSTVNLVDDVSNDVDFTTPRRRKSSSGFNPFQGGLGGAESGSPRGMGSRRGSKLNLAPVEGEDPPAKDSPGARPSSPALGKGSKPMEYEPVSMGGGFKVGLSGMMEYKPDGWTLGGPSSSNMDRASTTSHRDDASPGPSTPKGPRGAGAGLHVDTSHLAHQQSQVGDGGETPGVRRKMARFTVPAVWEAAIGMTYREIRRAGENRSKGLVSAKKMRIRIVNIIQSKMGMDTAADRSGAVRPDLAEYVVTYHRQVYDGKKRAAVDKLKDFLVALTFYTRQGLDPMVVEFARMCGLTHARTAAQQWAFNECLAVSSKRCAETQNDISMFWSKLREGKVHLTMGEATSAAIQIVQHAGQYYAGEAIRLLNEAAGNRGEDAMVPFSAFVSFVLDFVGSLQDRVRPRVLRHFADWRPEVESVGGAKAPLGRLNFARFRQAMAVLCPEGEDPLRRGAGPPSQATLEHVFARAVLKHQFDDASAESREEAVKEGYAEAKPCAEWALWLLDTTHLLNPQSMSNRIDVERLLALEQQRTAYLRLRAVRFLAANLGAGGAPKTGAAGHWATGTMLAKNAHNVGDARWKTARVKAAALGKTVNLAKTKGSEEVRSALLMNIASCYGDVEQLREHFKKGLAPNWRDVDKRTPLHVAASEGHIHIVELLLEVGADVNSKDRWGNTPLQEARRFEHPLVQHMLHSVGAVALGRPLRVKSPVDLVHNAGEELQAGELCEAAFRGRAPKIRELCTSGHSPDSSTYDWRTPMHVAAAEGILEVVRVLVEECGAYVNSVDRWGSTPLMEAQLAGHQNVVEFLTLAGGRGD